MESVLKYCIYLFFLPINTAFGLEPLLNFKHFGEAEGLTTKTIYSIIQDKEGFIWMATDAGVFRFDGIAFDQFSESEGLQDNEVLGMFQDSKDRIWFLTLNGCLSFWHEGKIHNSQNTDFLKDACVGSAIFSCREDKNGTLWFGCRESGIAEINANNKLTYHRIPGNKQRLFFPYIHEDHSGKIWYFYEDYLLNIHDNKDTIRWKKPYSTLGERNFPKQDVKAVSMNRLSNELFILFSDGVYRFSEKKISLVIPENHILHSTKVINLISENENFWFCMRDKGCYLYNNGEVKKQFLEGKSVTSVLRDKEGNTWFSTLSNGVYVLINYPNSLSNYDKTSGLADNIITSLAADKSGQIWMGFQNGYVQSMKNGKLKTYSLTGGSDYCRITSILCENDTIWFGTDRGIYFLNKEIIYPVIDSKEIYSRHPIKQLLKPHNTLYATFSLNFLKISREGNKFIVTNSVDSVWRTYAAKGFGIDTFLVSGNNNIFRFSPGKLMEVFRSEIDFSKERILDIEVDKSGSVILATNKNGIYFISDGKVFQHFHKGNGLSDNNCRNLTLNDSILYVSTRSGVSIIKQTGNEWKLTGVLTKLDGLLSNSINATMVYDSSLYIISDAGLSVFSLNNFASSAIASKIVITEIVSDKTYSFSELNGTLISSQSAFSLKYSYPVFNPQNRTPIKYRLTEDESLDSKWNTSSSREIQFTNLSHGRYIFQIKPDLKNALSVPVTSLDIIISPKWYQTIAFKCLMVVVFAAILILIFRFRIKSQYEKKLAGLKQLTLLESERNRIAIDMHDDIGADLTQISIWTNILKSKPDTGSTLIEKISRLSSDVLQKMDQIIWALNSINNDTSHLFSYIRSYATEFLESAGIKYDFSSTGDVPKLKISTFQRRNIFLVVKELLHNTVKHSGARIVKINISFEKEKLKIEYEDDGIGINSSINESGLGQSTIVKRLAEINSTIQIDKTKSAGFHAIIIVNLTH